VRPAAQIGSDSLQSPDDPEATFHRKEDAEFHGFVLHASETADPENGLQLITDVVVAPNNQADSRILHERLPEMHRKTPGLRELHTDAGYPSEDNDRLQRELGILTVQTAIRGRSARAPFQIERDEAGCLTIRCAAGHRVSGRTAEKHYKAEFAAANCAGCPFAAECTAQHRAHGGRTHYFTEADVLKQARHRRMGTLPEERRTLRANVEATMKQFKAPCRNGKLRTRGLFALRRYAFLRAIAINFGRVYRHLQRLASAPQAPTPVPPPAPCNPTALHGSITAPWRLSRAMRTWVAVNAFRFAPGSAEVRALAA
jgi:hypothetical protein